MKNLSKIALGLSVVIAVLAAVVSIFQLELWLAGTQWMIIAVLFGVWAIALDNCDCCKTKE
ncbi:MAG: hypothetical protein AAB487_02165 [Patescibacteria group bacterium]